jgi:hypothetical protein
MSVTFMILTPATLFPYGATRRQPSIIRPFCRNLLYCAPTSDIGFDLEASLSKFNNFTYTDSIASESKLSSGLERSCKSEVVGYTVSDLQLLRFHLTFRSPWYYQQARTKVTSYLLVLHPVFHHPRHNSSQKFPLYNY